MARISVADFDQVLFSTCLPVCVGDVNYGRHLSNDAVLRLCHEVRLRWLAKWQWDEEQAGGAGMIMADAAVQYLAQARHGDVLRIEMGATEVGGSRFTLLFRLIREQDGQIIAKAQTGMVGFDYAAQRVCRLSALLRKALEAV